jgi:hypothetical protein
VAQKDVTISSLSIKKNERVFLDIAAAGLEVSLNPVRFQYSKVKITSFD